MTTSTCRSRFTLPTTAEREPATYRGYLYGLGNSGAHLSSAQTASISGSFAPAALASSSNSTSQLNHIFNSFSGSQAASPSPGPHAVQIRDPFKEQCASQGSSGLMTTDEVLNVQTQMAVLHLDLP